MTGLWHKNSAKGAALVGCGLVFLATPGVARADDLGAIGEGMAVLLALAVTVVAIILLIITTAISAAFGRKESPRSLARRILAMVSLGFSVLIIIGNTSLFIAAFDMSAVETLWATLVALAIAAAPVLFGIRAVRYQLRRTQ